MNLWLTGPSVLLVGLTTATASEVLAGLPEYSITLTGTAARPELHNASGRAVLAYCLKLESQGEVQYALRTSLLRMRNAAAQQSPRDTSLIMGNGTATFSPSPTERNAMTAAALDAVMFADGEVVGPDTGHTFDILRAKIAAEQELHSAYLRGRAADLVDGGIAVDGDDQHNALEHLRDGHGKAPSGMTPRAQRFYVAHQRIFARELLAITAAKGQGAAQQVAKSSAIYPAPWRKGDAK